MYLYKFLIHQYIFWMYIHLLYSCLIQFIHLQYCLQQIIIII